MTREDCEAALRRSLEGFDNREAFMALVAALPFTDPLAFIDAALAVLKPAVEQRIASMKAEARLRAQNDADEARWQLWQMACSDTKH